MEKVINEFRVIETDDGFRIEIKGDKEKLRPFMQSFGMHKPSRGPSRHRRGSGWGPGFGPMMWMKHACFGPWGFEAEEEEEEQVDV